MGTIDHDLAGDEPWARRYPDKDRLSWWIVVKWIWRNGAQCLAYTKYGKPYDETWTELLLPGSDEHPEKTLGYKKRNYYHKKTGKQVAFYNVTCEKVKWLPGYYIERMEGWKYNNPVEWKKEIGGDGKTYIKIIRSMRLRRIGGK